MSATTAAILPPPAQRITAGYWSGVRRRIGRDKVTLVCAGILLLMLLAMIAAPWISPHPPFQGSMIRRLKPIGFPGYPLGTDELGRDILTRRR